MTPDRSLSPATGPTPAALPPRSRVLPGLAAACALLAGPAFGFCPATPADARAGFVVTYDDGSTMVTRILPDGLQEDIEEYNDGSGEGYLTRAVSGIYSVEEMPTWNGQPETGERWLFNYPGGLSSLPAITPRMRWDGSAEQKDDAGTGGTWSFGVSAGAMMTQAHAGCRMTAIPVVVRTTEPDGESYYLFFEYLPDIGVSLYRGIGDGPGDIDRLDITAFAPYPPG